MGIGALRRHYAAREFKVELVEPKGNASTAEWAAYASSLGHEVPDGAKRDEIKALLAPPPPPAFPDGKPTGEWDDTQITAWAKANEVDLGDATTVADMLAAIAKAAEPKDAPPSDDDRTGDGNPPSDPDAENADNPPAEPAA
jgi:hypothetical protein